jgi:hypothetical protein
VRHYHGFAARVSRIREIERLNPGMKVTLTPIDPAVTAA